jgi:hypothetical protein
LVQGDAIRSLEGLQTLVGALPRRAEVVERISQSLSSHPESKPLEISSAFGKGFAVRPALQTRIEGQVGNGQLRIVVEAELWVPQAEVGRAFKQVRDRLKPGWKRRARAVNPVAVALVAFVDRTPGSWRERLAAWNSANPKATYNDRANFRRTYEAARRRLDVGAPKALGV